VFIGQVLFKLARSPLGSTLVRFGVRRMSFAIPIKRLRETNSLLAFNHPQPSYPVHILIIPRKAYRSLIDLPPGDPFLPDLISVTQSLVRELNLDESGYRLIANGGAYQDVPVLHFHLVGSL
jgi:histidine triad (HIT) family protein